MPLCEQKTGWWLWKKPCEQWADGTCTQCGGRFCATRLRQSESALPCRACSPHDESWDTQASRSFSRSKHSRDEPIDGGSSGASDTINIGGTHDCAASDSGDSSGGGGSSD